MPTVIKNKFIKDICSNKQTNKQIPTQSISYNRAEYCGVIQCLTVVPAIRGSCDLILPGQNIQLSDHLWCFIASTSQIVSD